MDRRSAADVAQQLQTLLRLYAPDWNEVDPATGAPAGVSAALIGISAQFAEILIQRLNEVPQKNFLAFLELLGAALLPPEPARVPLTFLLAAGSLVDAVVPAGTQVAAPPGPGEKDPVIYEIEKELVVTAARLAWAFVRDPDEDTYAHYSNDILAAGSAGTPVFHGNRQVVHVLYLGKADFLDSPAITDLRLVFDLASPAGDDLDLAWEIWSGTKWQDITPAPGNDGTRSLSRSGTIDFGKVPAARATTVGKVSTEWMRCRLLTPITPSDGPRSGMARAAQLPQIRSVGMQVHLHNEGLPPDEAFSSASGPLDLSKDFYPFGEKPKFNDTLWLALKEAFAHGGATITLDVQVTNPGAADQTPPPAAPSNDLKLRWEAWNGSWVELGTSTKTGQAASTVNGKPFSDGTNAFSQNGKVTFTLPSNVAGVSVNGKENFWVRVRIVSGNYGVDAHYVAAADKDAGYKLVPPTLQPPSIHTLAVAYDLDKPAPPGTQALPDTVLAQNETVFTDLTARNGGQAQEFTPFQPSPDARPTLYFGFALPPGRATFPNNTITMLFLGVDLQYGQKTVPLAPDVSRSAGDPGNAARHTFVVTNPGTSSITYGLNVIGSQWTPVVTLANAEGGPSPATIELSAGGQVEIDIQLTVPAGTPFGASDTGILQLVAPDGRLYSAEFVTFAHEEEAEAEQLQLAWEYWGGQGWLPLTVRGETNNLTTTGTVEFLAPPDFARHREFDIDAWWLRVRWDAGEFDTDPRISRIFLNTTMAAQTVTIRNEVLGSSDGSASQKFRTTRAPVLTGQSLAVREPDMPSGDELAGIREDEGPDAVVVIPGSPGKPPEIWVTWHEVADFYASDAHSRHYTLDHISGEIMFGDGLSGLVPPVGTANIRLSLYKTGGGTRGNRPTGSVVQLKTTVPYIDKVTNYLAASGGADAETMDLLMARAPTEIRHRNRAVTREDYEDLVHEASPDVARVLCVPNRDLVADPLDNLPPILGNVSLVIVPDSTDAKPQPSTELVRRVQKFIAASCPVTATVLVVGPSYLRVDVEAEIGLAALDGAGTVAPRVQEALASFLHPLTGGFDGQGWKFGREPHRSDIYSVIEKIPEVDHIRTLTVHTTEEFPGSRKTGRFLVYSGTHTIKLVFEP